MNKQHKYLEDNQGRYLLKHAMFRTKLFLWFYLGYWFFAQ